MQKQHQERLVFVQRLVMERAGGGPKTDGAPNCQVSVLETGQVLSVFNRSDMEEGGEGRGDFLIALFSVGFLVANGLAYEG